MHIFTFVTRHDGLAPLPRAGCVIEYTVWCIDVLQNVHSAPSYDIVVNHRRARRADYSAGRRGAYCLVEALARRLGGGTPFLCPIFTCSHVAPPRKIRGQWSQTIVRHDFIHSAKVFFGHHFFFWQKNRSQDLSESTHHVATYQH